MHTSNEGQWWCCSWCGKVCTNGSVYTRMLSKTPLHSSCIPHLLSLLFPTSLLPFPSSVQLCAVFGVLVIPIAYMTVHELTRSCTAAFIASTLLICGESQLSWTVCSSTRAVGSTNKTCLNFSLCEPLLPEQLVTVQTFPLPLPPSLCRQTRVCCPCLSTSCWTHLSFASSVLLP